MALYPIDHLTRTETEAGMVAVPNGALVAIAVTIAPGAAIDINIVQTAPTQDFSLRCFVSDRPAGEAPASAPPHLAFWHAARIPARRIVLAASDRPAPDPETTILVPAGDYFVNVLNLANAPNAFAAALTDL